MGADDRRSTRANVILVAMIESATGPATRVRVSNLSANGALVIGEGIPPKETAIVLHCNGLSIESWVTWSDSGRAGIEFAEPVNPDTLTHRDVMQRAAIVRDNRNLDFKRPGFRGNQLSDEERRTVEEWKRSQDERPDEGSPPG